jgi:hypothetical protein
MWFVLPIYGVIPSVMQVFCSTCTRARRYLLQAKRTAALQTLAIQWPHNKSTLHLIQNFTHAKLLQSGKNTVRNNYPQGAIRSRCIILNTRRLGNTNGFIQPRCSAHPQIKIAITEQQTDNTHSCGGITEENKKVHNG